MSKTKDIMDALDEKLKQVEELKPLNFYAKDFEELLVKLSLSDTLNFYAHLIFSMRCQMTYTLPTAGIYYKNDNFNIDFNPVFMFETLKSEEDRMGVLIHEIMHALYLHFSRLGSRDRKLWNIAGDLTINQFLFKRLNSDSILKKIGCDLGTTFPFPENLTAEQYYTLLEKDKEQNPEKYEAGGEGELSMEDIMDSDEITEIEKEIIKDKLKDLVKKAKDKTRGNVPSEILNVIDLLFQEAKVDWRTELRHLVGNKKITKDYTIKRRNRRFPKRMDLCGKLKKQGFELAVVCDVSGSMSDEEIAQGLSEIKAICDWSQSSMTLVQVDTDCSEPEQFTGWERKFNRKRSGGTYLEPAIDMLDEHDIDYQAIIIITDGGVGREERWSQLDVPVFVLCTQDHCGFHMGENMRLFKLNDKK